MNVWVFNQFAGSPHNSSGAGERYHFIAKKLAIYNIDLTIFAASYNHLFINQPKVNDFFTVEYIDGVRYCWVKIPKYSPESGLGRISSWLIFMAMLFFVPSSKAPRPDTIIVSSMSMFPIYPALLKKLFSTRVKKIIFEIRDIWPLTLIEMGGYSKYNPVVIFLRVTEFIAYKYSDRIVSVLPFADRHIRSVIPDPFSFTWIPNGIDLKEFQVEENKERTLFDSIRKDYKFIVTYAGAVGKANALEPFLKAHDLLERSNNYAFVVLGSGPELHRLKASVKHNKSIFFVGKVPKTKVHALLCKSDILFIGWHDLPIYRFGVSANKYSDYMLARKPIVSSSNLEFEPVREADCGVVVEANNPSKIAAAIEELMSKSLEERVNLGDNGYSYLIYNNSMEVISDKFYKLLLT